MFLTLITHKGFQAASRSPTAAGDWAGAADPTPRMQPCRLRAPVGPRGLPAGPAPAPGLRHRSWGVGQEPVPCHCRLGPPRGPGRLPRDAAPGVRPPHALRSSRRPRRPGCEPTGGAWPQGSPACLRWAASEHTAGRPIAASGGEPRGLLQEQGQVPVSVTTPDTQSQEPGHLLAPRPRWPHSEAAGRGGGPGVGALERGGGPWGPHGAAPHALPRLLCLGALVQEGAAVPGVWSVVLPSLASGCEVGRAHGAPSPLRGDCAMGPTGADRRATGRSHRSARFTGAERRLKRDKRRRMWNFWTRLGWCGCRRAVRAPGTGGRERTPHGAPAACGATGSPLSPVLPRGVRVGTAGRPLRGLGETPGSGTHGGGELGRGRGPPRLCTGTSLPCRGLTARGRGLAWLCTHRAPDRVRGLSHLPSGPPGHSGAWRRQGGLSLQGSPAMGQLTTWQAAVRMHGQGAEWAGSHGHCHLHPEPGRQDDGDVGATVTLGAGLDRTGHRALPGRSAQAGCPPPTNPRTTRWTLPTAGHRVLGREAPRPSQPSRSFPTLRQGRALKRDSSHRGRAADADAGKAVAVTLADQTARLAPSAVLTAGGRPAGRQRRGLLNSHGARRPGDGQLASQPVLKLLGVREPRGLGRGQLVTASGRGTQGRALPTGRDEP